jgi:hypothetical protein
MTVDTACHMGEQHLWRTPEQGSLGWSVSAVVMRSETAVAGPVVEQDCALPDEQPGRTNRVEDPFLVFRNMEDR